MSEDSNNPTPADRLYSAFQVLDYDGFISHKEVDAALDLPLPRPEDHATTQDFVAAIRRRDLEKLDAFVDARDRLLLNDLKMLRSVTGEGYRVEMPNEQTATAMDSFARRATKALAVAMQQVANVNLALLNHTERTQNAMAATKLGALKAMVSKRTLGVQQDNVRKLGNGSNSPGS